MCMGDMRYCACNLCIEGRWRLEGQHHFPSRYSSFSGIDCHDDDAYYRHSKLWGDNRRPQTMDDDFIMKTRHLPGVITQHEHQKNYMSSGRRVESSRWMRYGADWWSGAGGKREMRWVRIKGKAELTLIDDRLQRKPWMMRIMAKNLQKRMCYIRIQGEREKICVEHQWKWQMWTWDTSLRTRKVRRKAP